MTFISPKDTIGKIIEYQPGAMKLPNVKKVHRLAFNESRIGPSPKAIAAADVMQNCYLYPAPGNIELCEAIAERYSVDVNKIFCGTGTA